LLFPAEAQLRNGGWRGSSGAVETDGFHFMKCSGSGAFHDAEIEIGEGPFAGEFEKVKGTGLEIPIWIVSLLF
jgi:hypothetical protein